MGEREEEGQERERKREGGVCACTKETWRWREPGRTADGKTTHFFTASNKSS